MDLPDFLYEIQQYRRGSDLQRVVLWKVCKEDNPAGFDYNIATSVGIASGIIGQPLQFKKHKRYVRYVFKVDDLGLYYRYRAKGISGDKFVELKTSYLGAE